MNTEKHIKPYNFYNQTTKETKYTVGSHFTYKFFRQQNSLIDEHKVNDLDPLYTLASVTRRHVI